LYSDFCLSHCMCMTYFFCNCLNYFCFFNQTA
jgi:hypothetical protein